MSCSTSSVVALGDAYRTPFTAVQWQELEHQALIYKYLVAGLPVPPDLVVPIRRSLEALSARFFHHPTLGYCSYYGKKFDPEPGRCRRTDGKKWRCSKDAYPDSKYCERHMHRGRNRSRKPVESHSTSSLSSSVSTVISSGGVTIAAGGISSMGSFQSGSAGCESGYQNMPSYANSNSENLCFGSNASKMSLENIAYGITNKDYRFIDTPNNFSLGGYNNNTNNNAESSTDASWPLMGSSLLKSNTVNPSQIAHMPQAFERQQQHCSLFGSEIGSPKCVKQEGNNSMRSFFDEWPKARDSWPSNHLDDDLDRRSSDNKTMNAFSSTQLSMSIPMGHPSDYSSSRNACSPDDA